MKKQLISTLLVASALSFVSAQTPAADTGVARQGDYSLSSVATGDVKIDAQIRALNKEMEAKIRAIREEYQIKLRALIGSRKVMIASTTQLLRERREELKDERKEKVEAVRIERQERKEEVRGTSTPKVKIGNRGATATKANPQGNARGFFMRFFGVAGGTSTQQ